jgi:hypothetical protein
MGAAQSQKRNTEVMRDLMARDSRGYYSRSHRDGQRIVRDYVGGGLVAELAELADQAERDERILQRAQTRVERDEAARLDAQVDAYCRASEALARLALFDAGYRQHDRGWWRRSRKHVQDS